MYNNYDYNGDMGYYQEQLAKKGITKEMLNMDDYAGLTKRELQCIVDNARVVKKTITENDYEFKDYDELKAAGCI